MWASITSMFEIQGENDNQRRVTNFCAERGLCVGNKYFDHKSLHKYTRVTKDILCYVQDVRAGRGMG